MAKTISFRHLIIAICLLSSVIFAGSEYYFSSKYDEEEKNIELSDAESEDEEFLSLAEVEENELQKVLHVTAGRGDTLATILNEHGLNPTDIHEISLVLKDLFPPKSLKPGQEIEMIFNRAAREEAPLFNEMRIRPDLDRVILVSKDNEGKFTAHKKQVPLVEEKRWAESPIIGSLYETAAQFKVPDGILHKMIMAFSYDIDFQRSLKEGDSFGVMYTVKTDPETGRARPGDLKYAILHTHGKPYQIYNFAPKGSNAAFYNEAGQSIKKGLLRTPVDGARISSHFGNRMHPIKGYTKKHKGTDFACPRGTPIFAAGDGIIEKASWFGSYGNYIRIRHANNYKTAYAHLSKYAKGARAGRSVRQGQVIGYVGSTGASTGPHLHLEVLYANRHINPMNVKSIPAAKLTGQQLQAFLKAKREYDRQYAELKRTPTLASTDTNAREKHKG